MSSTDPGGIATSGLVPLSSALRVLEARAELNHRYRRLIDESLATLSAGHIRRTQARGVAKKVVVLARTAGPGLRSTLAVAERDALDAGVAQAEELISQQP